jgi:hypothetical protein
MANKYHSDVSNPPTLESINWYPSLKTTGDLEAATRTISATTEASGLGNADYHTHLSMTAPPVDTRFVVNSLASRLSVTIDSDDGIHDLCCRVYIDAQDADHLIFDLAFTTTGNQLAVQPFAATTMAIIFNLLKDGASHTFYFYFWSPGSHSPVISVVQLQYGPGGASTTGLGTNILTFTSTPACEIQMRTNHAIVATGSQLMYAMLNNSTAFYAGLWCFTDDGKSSGSATAGASGVTSWTWQLLPAGMPLSILLVGTVATDFQSLSSITIFIKRWE